MKRTFHAGALGLAVALGFPACAIAQQTAPAAQNPLLEPARAAFEALPLDERKAIQDALVWAGDYTGGKDGTFGRLTFEAILGFELKGKLTADGILADKERAALFAAADKARAAQGFQVKADDRVGVRIGVPTRLIDKATARDRGMLFAGKDQKATLATEAYGAGEMELAALYDKVRADQPGRKVTYAVLRPDFFVVAGETAARKFYTRFAAGPTGLRGFTFSFDKALGPDLDRMTVAIANSFEPFPGIAQPVATGPAQTPATPPPAAQTARAQPASATGLAVAPGKVLTVFAAVDGCRTVVVSGRPAKVLAADKDAGLALLAADVGGNLRPSLRITPPSASESLIAMSQNDASGKAPGLGVAPAAAVATDAAKSGFRVLAPLQQGGTGSLVVDRSGAIAALVVGMPGTPRQIAGIVPEAAYDVAPGADLARFLAANGVDPAMATDGTGTRTAGEIATTLKGAVLRIGCER